MHCTVYLWACGRNLNTCRSISYIVPVFVEHRAIVQDYIYISEYISDLLTSVANIPCRSTLRASSCGNLVVPRTRRRVGDRAFSICCCTASMEQATDGAETAAIDGLISSWSENIFVSFYLRALRYGLTLWCALGLLVEAQYKCLSYSLQFTGRWLRKNLHSWKVFTPLFTHVASAAWL